LEAWPRQKGQEFKTNEPPAGFAVSFVMRLGKRRLSNNHPKEEPMLKKHMAACLVATAFIAAPALAQTSGSGGSSAGSAASSSSAASGGQFMTHMQPDQWRASKLVGVNIYGQNNEKIGDVNEVLIDRKGNADAVVIGVGGFLGMGEKDVAIPFSAIEWKYDRNDLSTASTNRPAGSAAGTTATTGAGTGSMATNPPAAGSPTASNNMATGGTTGSTATGTGAGAGPTAAGSANRAAGASSNMDRGYPDHGVIRMSKDQLQNAPTFRYSMTDASTAPARTTAPAGTTAPANPNAPAGTAPATAPKQ
jgi:sporulation protein YlmC with PRC-barrel domain